MKNFKYWKQISRKTQLSNTNLNITQNANPKIYVRLPSLKYTNYCNYELSNKQNQEELWKN